LFGLTVTKLERGSEGEQANKVPIIVLKIGTQFAAETIIIITEFSHKGQNQSGVAGGYDPMRSLEYICDGIINNADARDCDNEN
jgi:hypothetical protein